MNASMTLKITDDSGVEHIYDGHAALFAVDLTSQNNRLRAENAKLREALDEVGNRLYEHHNVSYRPRAGEMCTICSKSGNIFERIDTLLKRTARATGHEGADGGVS